MLQGIEDQDWPKIMQVVAEVHPVDDRLQRFHRLLRANGFTVSTQVTVGKDLEYFHGDNRHESVAIRLSRMRH